MSAIIRLLRIEQYVKNAFVFAPFVFAFQYSLIDFIKVVEVFILFCTLASSAYIFNDYLDINADREHPEKKNRPLASGAVSELWAGMLFVGLTSFSLISAWFLERELFLILLSYWGLNLLYSFKLKHVSIVDIVIIATGFVFRLFAGNSVLATKLSMWIVVITFLLALFLALAKRRDDVLLARKGKSVRKNIDGYNLEFINITMTLKAGVIIVSYILYTISSEVVERIGSDHLYITAVFVIMGILRYLQVTFVIEKSGNPTKIVLSDRFLQITIILWLVSFLWLSMGVMYEA